MKTYSQAPDAEGHVEKMRASHHEELEGVTIAPLFVFDSEESSLSVLKHGGYWAAATMRITPLKDRALGIADAQIVIDRACWAKYSARQRNALVDHELTHLTRKIDKETGEMVTDALDRPKLILRKHDHQFGWFDEVAQRHGEASIEVQQARRLVEISGQLYFDFSAPPATPPKRERKVADRADLNG
jgi:hypothetical protein